jgi:hypothetical protein
MDELNTQPGMEQPISPEGGMMPPSQGGGEQLMSPEQRQELLGLIDQIRGSLQDFSARHLATKDNINKDRLEMLRKVFEILELSGADLGSQESVSDFIEKLKAKNPELAQWFEQSMEVLLGQDVEPVQDESVLNENQYENGDTDGIPPQDIPQGL